MLRHCSSSYRTKFFLRSLGVICIHADRTEAGQSSGGNTGFISNFTRASVIFSMNFACASARAKSRATQQAKQTGRGS